MVVCGIPFHCSTLQIRAHFVVANVWRDNDEGTRVGTVGYRTAKGSLTASEYSYLPV